MAGQLEGKVALVTGGSTGIGRAAALAFAMEGAKVVVGDVDPEGGEETINQVRGANGEGMFVRTDVSRSEDVLALVAEIVKTYGSLDCAHNNAGVLGPLAPIPEYPEEDWNRVINTNVKGVWLCMKFEIAQMLKQGGGSIVNTASVAGLVGSRTGQSAYNASKHAVVGLTRTAALENAQKGIRVNVVCPGTTRTQMMDQFFDGRPDLEESVTAQYPIGRLGKPDEIAEAVVWLCSDAASFVTGHAFPVDGGFVAQ